jgi:LysM repeat protein
VGPIKHIVKKGDTLGKIAKLYYGDSKLYKQIAAFNHIKDADVIEVGDEIIIPPRVYGTKSVEKGDEKVVVDLTRHAAVVEWETRKIIVAEGAEFHDVYVPFLEKNLGAKLEIGAGRLSAKYENANQGVRYEIEIVRSKSALKTALETPGVIVVYDGHSRYGRGACFGDSGTGNTWGDGDGPDDGTFRLGYELVPVEVSDILHHQYRFAPVAFEEPAPAREKSDPYTLHPEARRALAPIRLAPACEALVIDAFKSPSNRYYGYGSGSKAEILIRAGWSHTAVEPYDLGSTELKCRTFCHFGCSSAMHFHKIIRLSAYKGWSRPEPPTERLAYFTTNLSTSLTAWWTYYLLVCPMRNSDTHWWDTHEWAKSKANEKLKKKMAGFLIY